MEKKIPVRLLVLVVFLGLNFTILFGGLVRHVERYGIDQRFGSMGYIAYRISLFPQLVNQSFNNISEDYNPLIIKNRFSKIDGFTKNGLYQKGAIKDEGYLLLSAYNIEMEQSSVRLVRISNNEVLHEWVPHIPDLRESHKTTSPLLFQENWRNTRFRIMHPLLLSDGGIVFKNNEGPLFKINACSKIEWVVDGVFHHSTELDADGNFWVPFVIEPTSYDGDVFIDFRDDAIAKISSDGSVLYRKSVSEILEMNGYRGLLFGAGPYDKDPVHLNDIQPALYTTEYWNKGDLLLSLRHRSTIILYRPTTDKIIWLQTGPWLAQHDVDFIGDAKISVFGNDAISYPGNILRGEKRSVRHVTVKHNEIYVFNFRDNRITTPYAEMLKKFDVRTPTEGRQEFIKDGDVFVEETDYGRLLRISRKRGIWEFTIKADRDAIVKFQWCRYLSKDQVENILPVLKKEKCS